VILGEPPDAGQVFFVAETPDGSLYFRDAEWDWPLPVRVIEDVAPADLPEYYAQFRTVTRILPVRDATGPDREDAYAELMRQIEALADSGAPARLSLASAAT
jgi:hypothetical protein